jgi:hypothetical protein
MYMPMSSPPSLNIAPGSNPDQGPEEERIIGDFDGSADPLWSLYRKEAKSYDESSIQNPKEDMDGVIFFVRSYFVYSCGLGNADL